MTRQRIISISVSLMTVGLFLVDAYLPSDFFLPVMIYTVPTFFAIYFLSTRLAAAITGWSILLAALGLGMHHAPLWIMISHLSVMVAIGCLGLAFGARRWREVSLVDEHRRLLEQLQTSEEWYRQIVETAQEGIGVIDAEGKISTVNSAMAEMLGYTTAEMVGRPLSAFLSEAIRPAAADFLKRRDSSTTEKHDLKFRRKDGTDLWAMLSTNRLFDRQGRYVGLLGMVTDITERKRVEEALRGTSEFVRALIVSSPLAIITTDLEGNIKMWNRAAERIFGWTEEEVIGRPNPIVPKDHWEEFRSIQQRLWQGEVFTDLETRRMKKDGTLFDISVSTAMLRDGNGDISGAMAVITDIAERKRAQEALHQSEERYKNLIELAPDIVYALDSEGNLTFINDAAYRLLEAPPEEVIGQPWLKWIHPDDRDRALEQLNESVEHGRDAFGIEARCVSTKGNLTYFLHNVRVLQTQDGEFLGLQGIAQNITDRKRAEEERKRYEEELAFLATHDPLTGLANRRLLEETMSRTMARARRGVFSTLLFLDLDNFKSVNDTLNHATGDQVLVKLAQLLRSQLRAEDLLARLGGDEFAALLEDTGVDQARFVAERMCAVIRRFHFVEGGHRVDLGLSVGIAVINGLHSPLEVISLADAAMYRAKQQGGNQVILQLTEEVRS